MALWLKRSNQRYTIVKVPGGNDGRVVSAHASVVRAGHSLAGIRPEEAARAGQKPRRRHTRLQERHERRRQTCAAAGQLVLSPAALITLAPRGLQKTAVGETLSLA